MQNHHRKEQGVKPWERAVESSYDAPRKRKIDIACIEDFTSISIPSTDEDFVTIFGGDDSRILKGLPGELGKCLSRNKLPAFLCSKAIFLTACRVPDPINEQVGWEEKC